MKDPASLRNMEISFLMSLAENAESFNAGDIDDLRTMMDIRDELENNPELKDYSGLLIYGTNKVLTREALACDCGKGFYCPKVVQQ